MAARRTEERGHSGATDHTTPGDSAPRGSGEPQAAPYESVRRGPERAVRVRRSNRDRFQPVARPAIVTPRADTTRYPLRGQTSKRGRRARHAGEPYQCEAQRPLGPRERRGHGVDSRTSRPAAPSGRAAAGGQQFGAARMNARSRRSPLHESRAAANATGGTREREPLHERVETMRSA